VGRESYVNTDLLFDPKVNDLVTSWPTENREITARLRKTEKECVLDCRASCGVDVDRRTACHRSRMTSHQRS
jgi:hypothetical protein